MFRIKTKCVLLILLLNCFVKTQAVVSKKVQPLDGYTVSSTSQTFAAPSRIQCVAKCIRLSPEGGCYSAGYNTETKVCSISQTYGIINDVHSSVTERKWCFVLLVYSNQIDILCKMFFIPYLF